MKKTVAACLVLALITSFFTACAKKNTGYNYDNSAAYTAGDFTYNEDSIDSVEINWISGNVSVEESVMDELSVHEECGEELSEDYQLHYLIKDRKLIIQFCKSGADFDALKKDLYVTLPILLDNVSVNVVSAASELSSSASTIDINTVSGAVWLGIDQCEKLYMNSVSGDLNVYTDSSLGVKTKFTSVSGKMNGGDKTADKMCEIECNTVSGDLNLNGE